MTDSKITSAVETSTKFSVETDLIKSAFPILRAVAENKKNPRGMFNSLYGFTADNSLVFKMSKDSLTIKAADVKNNISLAVKNIPIKNFGAPATVAFQNSKLDTIQKVLKTLNDENSNFAFDGDFLKIFGEIADKVKWKKTDEILDWFDAEGKRYFVMKEKVTGCQVLSKKEITKFSFYGCNSIDANQQELFQKFFPTDKGKTLFKIDGDILIEMLNKTENFIPKNDFRFENVFFAVEDNFLKIVTGSRNSIGCAKNPLKAGNCKFALPSSCLKPLKQLIKNRMSDDLIEFQTNGDKIQIVQDGVFTTVLTISAVKNSPFERAENFFVTEKAENIRVNVAKFKAMAEMAMTITDAKNVTFSADAEDSGTLIVSSFSPYSGQMKISGEAIIEEQTNFALSCEVLKKSLTVWDVETVKIYVTEKAVILKADRLDCMMSRAKVDAKFSEMSFQDKKIYISLQTQLDGLDNFVATKIARYKSRKEKAADALCRRKNALMKLEGSLKNTKPDANFTEEIISEGLKKAWQEYHAFEARYFAFEKAFEARAEKRAKFLNEMADKQRESLQIQIQEFLNKAA